MSLSNEVITTTPDVWTGAPGKRPKAASQVGQILLAAELLAVQGSVTEFDLDAIPRLLQRTRPANSKCVFENDPDGIAAEQYRMMQRRLSNFAVQGGSALLTSPGAGEGKSLNAHNLAYALAEAGQSTLLLELDLRRPTQAQYISERLDYSVVDVLSGTVTAEQAVRRISSAPLFFIGLEHAVGNPTKLLRSSALEELLSWAKRNFTWVIIDGPPILAIVDVEEILPHVDLTLMVVRERVTPSAMLARAAKRLGDRLSFIIFNDVHLSQEYGYGYGYSSGRNVPREK